MGWVLMQEVLTSLQMSTIEVTTEVKVFRACLNGCTHFIDRHLAIVHLSIINAECCAGRRPYDQLRVIVGYHLARQLAVLTLVDFPWTAVRLIFPKVKGSETFAVERYPGSICFRYNRALTVQFHESRGASIADDLIDK